MNESYGGPTKLPFDLQHRRWPIRYRLTTDADKEQLIDVTQTLSENIEYAIRSVLQSGIINNTINSKDRRVAIKFANALSRSIGMLAMFLTKHGFDDGMKIILQDYNDEPGSDYPSPKLVEPILTILSRSSLKSPGNVQIGERVLSWAEIFINDLNRTAQGCSRILDQYADRDDTLIALVEDINNKSELLIMMISTTISAPPLTHLYDNGIPDVHINEFRDFLLAVLKSYRVIRQFGVKVE
jgi:hypothetical protein